MSNDEILQLVDFSKGSGLVTAIAQDAENGDILMLANMNQESFKMTLECGEAVYWSRSRNKLWHKGEESGNVQQVQELFIDCDGDAVLMKVKQIGGAACHTGKHSCFFRKIEHGQVQDIGKQVFDPMQEPYQDMRDCENKNLKVAFLFITKGSFTAEEIENITRVKDKLKEKFEWATDDLATVDARYALSVFKDDG